MARVEARTGDRRTDVLIWVRLDSDDTRTEEDAIVEALVNQVEGTTIYPSGVRSAQVVDSVEVVEIETVQRGKRA